MSLQTMCKWELSHIHAYKFKWLHTHTHVTLYEWIRVFREWLNKGGICKHLSGVISVLSSVGSEVSLTRSGELLKRRADLSCHFKLSAPCDHGVIMSCVLRSATCQPVVFGLTAAFHVGLWFLCSFSPTDVQCCRAKRSEPVYPAGTSPVFLHKVGPVLTFVQKFNFLYSWKKKKMHYLMILYENNQLRVS